MYLGGLSFKRGHIHLPTAFYRIKIGQILAELCPKKLSETKQARGQKGSLTWVGALIGDPNHGLYSLNLGQ